MYKILFVTDDSTRKKPLKSGLLEQGFAVTVAASSELLSETAKVSTADVLLLDLERCATEPATLCQSLKRQPALRELPLVLLVPEEQLGRIDVAWGLEDYLTLPVSVARVAQRVRFLMWKLHRAGVTNGFSHGELVVDFDRYEVLIKGEPVDLTYKEFELLKFLITHPDKVFTREQLLDKVWGYDFYGGTRTVDVHVRRVRAKIELGRTTYIETVRNVGYKFLGTSSER